MSEEQAPGLRIKYSYGGKTAVFEARERQVLIGRSSPQEAVDLDLAPDRKVSRRHALISQENGQYWIEDLNSSLGTQVGDSQIKGQGKSPLATADKVHIGDTLLTFETLIPQEASPQVNQPYDQAVLPPSLGSSDPNVEIAGALEVKSTVLLPVETATAHILDALCELPLEFAAETRFDALIQKVVSRLAELLPREASTSVLLKDPECDVLLLKAYRARCRPVVSETLARRSMTEQKAFVWKRSAEGDLSGSILQERIETGMYAPLLWQGKALGAISVHDPNMGATFSENDLRLLVVVAQYAAMAVAGHQLQKELRRESATKANLLRQFSAPVAERLLEHRGRLRLGGERSEATILYADIRGFTSLASAMEPDDVVEMLNEYFAQLVPHVFEFEGTVDKYVGDAILAIFGSPEPDPEHREHGVRAALEMQAAVAKLNTVRQARGALIRGIGIGIHCGDVVHGFVGTADRMEFTVIGDAVNRASRYCQGAAGGEVLISPEVYERVWKTVEAERITISTKHEGDFIGYRVQRIKKLSEKKATDAPT